MIEILRYTQALVSQNVNFIQITHNKKEHYSTLKLVLRIVTLGIAIWALVVAYQAKTLATWVDDKQDNVIQELMFPKR